MYSQYVNFTADEFAVDPRFRRWCLSEDTDAEAFWRVFLQHYPDKVETVEQARQMVIRTAAYFEAHTVSEEKIEASYQKMLRTAGRQPPVVKWHQRRYWSVAATVTLLLAAAIIGYFMLGDTEEPVLAEYRTGYGEQQTVELPDGSTVQLNAHSRLTLDERWDTNARREVWLEGEAYFSVEKKPTTKAKFIVRTPGLDVEVLGTQFNVNTQEEITQVALDEGHVKLLMVSEDSIHAVTMRPGEVASYTKLTHQISKQRMDTQPYSTWKDGYLTYQEATLSEVLDDVQATYGYTVVVQDSLLMDETITGALSAQDLDTLLVVLEDIIPSISFTKKDDQLIVTLKE